MSLVSSRSCARSIWESNLKYNLYNNVFGDTIWIGVDDTDSRNGGCTTFVARQIIERMLQAGYSIIGYPRLIRLNPNIPWKTRGNGALAFQVEKNGKSIKTIGGATGIDFTIADKPLETFSHNDGEFLRTIIVSVLDEYAQIKGKNTNPGAVLSEKQPPFLIYQQAVHKIVTIKDIKAVLNTLSAITISYKNARGLIGASAAIAWRPNHDVTYELISYRQKSRWGTPRIIDPMSVQLIDTKVPTTFDNYDYNHAHNRITPNSPCPILYGIRGDVAADLPAAMQMVISEPYESWLIFQTNQGTDDHIQPMKIKNVQPYYSARIQGQVAKTPYTIQGGHVIFSIEDDTGILNVAAYEPTKEFRQSIRKLVIGDVVEIYGGVRKNPLTVNLEKIHILKLSPLYEKKENPTCPACGKHMKSIGKQQGFRCKKCGTSRAQAEKNKVTRDIQLGWYEVPVCARRHLSKPLKRMQN